MYSSLQHFLRVTLTYARQLERSSNKICLSKIYIYRKFNIGRLEWVLIARRFLFEKTSIMVKGYSSQLKGVLCNIPIDVINVCNTLPRPADSKVIIIVKLKRKCQYRDNVYFEFFFYLVFLWQTFTNHRTAGEGGGHFFNLSLPLPHASKKLRH